MQIWSAILISLHPIHYTKVEGYKGQNWTCGVPFNTHYKLMKKHSWAHFETNFEPTIYRVSWMPSSLLIRMSRGNLLNLGWNQWISYYKYSHNLVRKLLHKNMLEWKKCVPYKSRLNSENSHLFASYLLIYLYTPDISTISMSAWLGYRYTYVFCFPLFLKIEL